MRRDVSSADSEAAAELTAMIKEQAATLVKEMSKKKSFKRCHARDDEESDENKNNNNNNNNENNKNDDANDDANANANDNDNRDNKDGDTRKDDGPYAWIGKWVPKPKGERCRRCSTTKKGHTHKGFTTKTLLEKARITEDKYRMYKVCFRFAFGFTTDSPQKTAHQLIGRYFDITKSIKVNQESHPDGWTLIVEKVRPLHSCSMLLTFLQMKARHPRCRWHSQNWVLKHITVMHLDAMRRSLKQSDSDLKVLEEYEQLTKGPINKRKIRLVPESESESEVSLHLQFTPYNPPQSHSV